MFKFLLSILFLVFSLGAHALTHTLELSESDIQSKLSAMPPIQKEKFFVTVILTHLKASLARDANTLSLTADIEARGPAGLRATGRATIQGSLRYEPKSGSFFLEQPVISELFIEKFPEKYQRHVKDAAQTAASNLLAERPVYTLHDAKLKEKLAKALLKSVAVKNSKLFIELSLF